jgi:hypothetical protein
MVKLTLLVLALALFLFQTVQATAAMGYLGFFEAMGANPATNLAMLDLVIALTLITIWMWGDSRERSVHFWGYVVVTALFGVAGPLGYLIHREAKGLLAQRRHAAA